MKELSDISWQVSEETYRADPALSYSTLATYEKSGFDELDHLFDKKESPSLLLGSVVDTILTGGMDEFNQAYQVTDVHLTEGGMNVCNKLISMNLPYKYFEEIPEQTVSNAAKEIGFWKADKWDKKRYAAVLETGNIGDYYRAQKMAHKIIITSEVYNEALAMVRALRESPSTAPYFADNDPMSPIKRYYQLKFKNTIKDVAYRSMADLIVCNYETKRIFPCDLKTSGKPEWHFEESFLQWMYPIQARLYWLNIRVTLDKDPYFKDFALENYKFIVVNKTTLTPLVWEFPLTKERGTLVDESGNKYRDPLEIGKELKGYLDLRPVVPNGISLTKANTINCLKKIEK